jgi:hypothetical protein
VRGGLDAKSFRGFQLAGELFLLTSFFIEPESHSEPEIVRILPECSVVWASQPAMFP